MRTGPTAAAVPLLLLVLTWLSFHAFNADAEMFDRALGTLDRFAITESALQRDVLSARVGLSRNYDPLVRETSDLDELLLQLREPVTVDAETAATIDRLAASTASQEGLVEQFKSNNALLQNSLAYFGLFSSRLSASNRTGPIVPAVSELAAAILHLTLDTSPEAKREVEYWLTELAGRPALSDDARSVRALLAHGHVLLELLPATDSVLKALRAVPQRRDREALRSMVLTRQIVSRATARKFRLLLYLASLLLVAVLVHLGLVLRARALALHQRAAFEHALAGISTGFINAKPSAIGAHVENALAELADRVGAERAYFVSSAKPTQRHVWHRNGFEYPPGWPDRALEITNRLRPATEGIIHIPTVDKLPLGKDKETFVSAGLHGWLCASITSGEASVAILGFDLLRADPSARCKDFGLLRMALDALANAVWRSYLEQERAGLEQRLQQGRRMETVGALTSGIAHNFNNIIAAILGYAEIAEAQVVPDSQPAGTIAEIRRAGERARDLIDQILAFGRRRDPRRKPVCLRDLVAEAISMLQVSLPSGIELTLHDASGPAIIFGERGQLHQVILNLCNNAAQAMGGSGRIELETEIHEIACTRQLSHGDLPPGRYVRIAVCDSGRGIDAAILNRIFEPFFTTRTAGNGLGLATVHEIVGDHGGMMNVRSAPGTGSRFEAWLPSTSIVASASEKEPPMLALGCGETVLVVDEEGEQLLRDEEILAALGYEPVGFTRADDALMACRESPKRFDILVVGPLVPAASMLELASALHAIAPDLPILLAAVMANEIGADALLAAGISDVVHWPIIATEMAAALAGSSTRQKSGGKTPGPQNAGRNP
jgi:signal transduction histidine kinase